MDSLDMVEIIMELEIDGGIEMTDGEAARMRDGTAADLWRVAVRLRTGAAPVAAAPSAGDATWQQVRRILARVRRVPMDDVGPDLRLAS